MRDNILVKIGGKILEDFRNLVRTIAQFEKLIFTHEKLDKVLILPGGGSYANFVRMLDHKLNLGNDLAHWMAIYAMNENAKELYKKNKDKVQLIQTFIKLKQILENPKEIGIYIFTPFDFLYETDSLPHTWEVTSDSIALSLSHSLNLNKCFLIKDVDGIYDKNDQLITQIKSDTLMKLMENKELKRFGSKKKENKKKSKPLDPFIFNLINKYKISCTILNGVSKNCNILNYFITPNEKFKKYTEIIPS